MGAKSAKRSEVELSLVPPSEGSRPWLRKLGEKQRRFVEVFNGDSEQSARLAGYSDPADAARSLMSNEAVRDALYRKRRPLEREGIVAGRQDRLAFWSRVMDDEAQEMSVRLRASELLAKSDGDFVERREVLGAMAIETHSSPGVRASLDEQVQALLREGLEDLL